MKNSMATLFACYLLFSQCLPSYACVPFSRPPMKMEEMKEYLDKADMAFIGTLAAVDATSDAYFKIEKPLKNVEAGSYIGVEGINYGCGNPPPGGLWLYFRLPPRPLPPELQKILPLIENLNGENMMAQFKITAPLAEYRAQNIFQPLRGQKGIIYPEEASVIKELFKYDVAEAPVLPKEFSKPENPKLK